MASDICGIINAGGTSQRMGANKALLRLGDRTIIERIAGVLARCTAERFIVANSPEEYRGLGLAIHPDIHPGTGALGGIETALTHSAREYNFITACDTPFLTADFVELLASEASGYDAVVVRSADGFEPFSAIYSKSILPVVAEAIGRKDLAIHKILKRIRTRAIDIDSIPAAVPPILFNINTPEDYELAKKLLLLK